jgi:predicted ATPase
MVGREGELKELKTFLDRAREGHGNTVFIAGEAGVGKTRLLEELKGYAKEQGVDVLQGWSLYESLTPYMPFLEALRSGGLESLFADETPRVEAVYLVSHSGMSIKEVIREETKLDPDIFSGMLTAVGDFVQDSLSMLTGKEKEGFLKSLGYENYRIIIESLGNINLAVILSGRENEFLVNDMKEILISVNKQYGNVLKDWDGNEQNIAGIQHALEPLITSGKYDGIDYAKDNPKVKRNRLFENILMGIERHTKVNPSLLCIEDLQWTDPSSLALMHYVARNTRMCNLLILGTYRPEDVVTSKDGEVHPLINTMQLMGHEDLFLKLELERLKEDHIDEILSSFFEHSNFPDEFKAQLYKETEGNPYFIISLLRMLIEEGTIENKNEIWILAKELKDAKIPSKVYDVIIRRLYRVKEKERDTIEYAAVIGEEFNAEILASATHLDKIELLKQLRKLEQNHKLIRSTESKYKFDHAKIKEVLYNQIPPQLRKELHTIIADVIKKLNKNNLELVMGDLAFQYYYSFNPEKALPYLIKAAEKAKKEFSNEEAILFSNRALEFETDLSKKLDLFEALGDIYLLKGDFDKSITTFNKVLELVEKSRKKAEIIAKIGQNYENKGEFDEALKTYIKALKFVKGKECKEEALVYRNLGVIYWHKGEIDEALEHLNNSLIISDKINDQLGIAASHHEIGRVHWYLSENKIALENLMKSLTIRQNLNDQEGIANILNNISLIHLATGEYDKAIRHFEESLKRNKMIGSQKYVGKCLVNLGFTYLYKKEYDKSLIYFQKSLHSLEKIIAPRHITFSYCGMAELYFRKEKYEKALKYCILAYDLSNNIKYKPNIAFSKKVFGMIYKKQKNWKRSIMNFEESIKIFIEIDQKQDIGDSYFEFGLMWKEKGDFKKAKNHMEKAIDIYEGLNLNFLADNVKKELYHVNKKENSPTR